MDEFDFSAPISATIIFDDSNDETYDIKPSIKDLIKTEKEEIASDSSKVVQVHYVIENQANLLIVPKTISSKTETLAKLNTKSSICELNNNIKSISEIIKHNALQHKPLDMPPLNEIEENKNVETEQQVRISIEDKNIIERTFTKEFNNCYQLQKTMETSTETKKHNKRLTKDLIPLNKNNETETNRKYPDDATSNNNKSQNQNSSTVKIYSKYFANPSSEEIFPKKLQKKDNETEKTCMPNIETNLTKQTTEAEKINNDECFPSQNEYNKTLTNYRGLLNTVSEHMIYIINTYKTFVKMYQDNTNPILIENAKKNFIRIRNYFFDLSYSSVVNIIIPKNNDSAFVKNFITDTIQIGHSKSCYYTYEEIEQLYKILIIWVQKRKVEIQNININATSCPILAKELQKPYSGPPFTHNIQRIEKHNPIPVRNSNKHIRPRGNTNKSLHLEKPSQRREPYLSLHQVQNPVPQHKPPSSNSNNSQQFLEGLLQNRYCYLSPHDSIYVHQQNKQMPQFEYQIKNTHPEQNTLQTLNCSLQKVHSPITPIHSYLNNNKAPRFPSHQNSTPSWPNPVKPVEHQQTINRWHNENFASYTQNYQQQTALIPSQNYNQNPQPEKAMTDELNRSSISRDSGFMSPVTFSTNNDLTLQEEQRSQPSATPLITHVTSLNPNACHIKDGNCAVCEKVTKQKCLGCFNRYYCSHGCQYLDWKIHQLVCK